MWKWKNIGRSTGIALYAFAQMCMSLSPIIKTVRIAANQSSPAERAWRIESISYLRISDKPS